MSFWSGEKIQENLEGLIEPPSPNRIDCAAYTLALGSEVFVTSDQRLEDSSLKGLKHILDDNGQCRIPPGQFAFLLTEEVVRIPNTVIAFISMKATYKFKGLVNVSGFHVDPGYYGRLVFSVYNAGPAPIVVSRGTPMFLIWFSDLDRQTNNKKSGDKSFEHISDTLINNMAGQVFSPLTLAREVTELRESQLELKDTATERHAALRIEFGELRSEHNLYKKLVWALLSVVALYVVRIIFLPFVSDPALPSTSTKTPSAQQSVTKPPVQGLDQVNRGADEAKADKGKMNGDLPNGKSPAETKIQSK